MTPASPCGPTASNWPRLPIQTGTDSSATSLACEALHSGGLPVISVDTKKKELIGPYKNPGKTWRRKPQVVFSHDFSSYAVGKAVPYGIYDPAYNDGPVVVGTSHETPTFAVACIRRWWLMRGPALRGRRLLIQADAGGANDYRKWEWKVALQKLADESDLAITVTHYPPGASKWNPIDHRMLSLMSGNWAGEPLVSYEKCSSTYAGRGRPQDSIAGRSWIRRSTPQGGR